MGSRGGLLGRKVDDTRAFGLTYSGDTTIKENTDYSDERWKGRKEEREKEGPQPTPSKKAKSNTERKKETHVGGSAYHSQVDNQSNHQWAFLGGRPIKPNNKASVWGRQS